MHGSPEELFRAVTTGLAILTDATLRPLFAVRAVPAALTELGTRTRAPLAVPATIRELAYRYHRDRLLAPMPVT